MEEWLNYKRMEGVLINLHNDVTPSYSNLLVIFHLCAMLYNI